MIFFLLFVCFLFSFFVVVIVVVFGFFLNKK